MTDFYLIGPSIARFVGRNPPTLRQILQIVLHKTTVLKNNLRESIKETLDDLVIYYETQGVQTSNVYKLIDKVEKIHSEWKSIRKSKTSTRNEQIERRETFTRKLDAVFEIERIEMRTKSVLTQTIPAPIDQSPIVDVVKRGIKRVSESTQDIGSSSKRINLDEIEGNDFIFCQKYARLLKLHHCYFKIEDEIEMESSGGSADDEDDDYGDNSKKKLKFVIDKRVAAALDACNVSDYGAMHIISAVAQALGFKISDLVLSRQTIRRARNKYRKEIATEVKQNFKVIYFDKS